jgi:hypothetical protein
MLVIATARKGGCEPVNDRQARLSLCCLWDVAVIILGHYISIAILETVTVSKVNNKIIYFIID